AAALEGRDFWDGAYQPRHRSPLLQVASVTHTIASSTIPPQIFWPDHIAPLKLVARDGNWTLWKHPQPWPRVYLSRWLVRQPAAAQLSALNRLAAQSFTIHNYPVMVSPQAFPFVEDESLTAGDQVMWWNRDLNEMQIQTQTTSPSVLVQSEAWYPGWQAWVNGQSVPLEQANFLFRGVAVPAGVSSVRVVYDPAIYRFGLFCSLCGVAMLGAWAVELNARGSSEALNG
ncbi:MAG: YfhO family protein, partial [Abitibacteriaceae bacterium]|nr:YfhO family protein [Abditibacteriaceae bacterium]